MAELTEPARRLMVFLEFLVFLDFLETSEVVGPGPNPREIDILSRSALHAAGRAVPWRRTERI